MHSPTRRTKALAPFLVLPLALLLHAAPSKALSVVPNPVLLGFGPDLEVEFLGAASGVPGGGSVLAGTVSAGDDTLIFQATARNGDFSIPSDFGIQPDGGTHPVVGVGTIAGADIDVVSGLVGGVGAYGGVTFGTDPIPEDVSTDPFFLSFGSLSDGYVLRWGVTGGLVLLGTTSTVEVPEVGAGPLAGVALVLFAARRGRRMDA